MILPTLIVLTGMLASVELDRIKQESNPGKRADQAIEYSQQKLATVRELFDTHNQQGLNEALEEVAAGAELALAALDEKRNIGKTKKAEQRCREMSRKLETLKLDLPVEQRDFIEKILERIHHVQDELVKVALRKKK